MAKDNFYNLGFGSVPKVQQYSNVFKSLGDTLKKPFEESITKTKNLMALMPNGVPIDKVPEEIRGQVTDFLSKNKKSYADAAQTLATSPMGSDKYNEAMDILNGVKAKFENLSLSLEAYQQNAKLSLETFDQLALSNDQNRKLDHSNMANGNVLQSFEIDESGNGSFLSSNGDRIKFTDYKAGFVDDGALIGSYLQLTEAAQKEGLAGINFDPVKYEAAIKTMFKSGGIDRVINFAYDGVKTGNLLDDSQPIQFIHQYIQNKTGKKPGDEGYEQLLEEYKKDEGLIDAFGNHLLGVLRDQYHGGGMQQYSGNRNIRNNRNNRSGYNPPPADNTKNEFSNYLNTGTIPLLQFGNRTEKDSYLKFNQDGTIDAFDKDNIKFMTTDAENLKGMLANIFSGESRTNINEYVDREVRLASEGKTSSIETTREKNQILEKYDPNKGEYKDFDINDRLDVGFSKDGFYKLNNGGQLTFIVQQGVHPELSPKNIGDKDISKFLRYKGVNDRNAFLVQDKGNIYKLITGNYSTLSEAQEIKDKIINRNKERLHLKGFFSTRELYKYLKETFNQDNNEDVMKFIKDDDAFIYALYNGKRIRLNEAKKLLEADGLQ